MISVYFEMRNAGINVYLANRIVTSHDLFLPQLSALSGFPDCASPIAAQICIALLRKGEDYASGTPYCSDRREFHWTVELAKVLKLIEESGLPYQLRPSDDLR